MIFVRTAMVAMLVAILPIRGLRVGLARFRCVAVVTLTLSRWLRRRIRKPTRGHVTGRGKDRQ